MPEQTDIQRDLQTIAVEMRKLHELYDSLMEARRDVGENVVPFHKLANLVKDQR